MLPSKIKLNITDYLAHAGNAGIQDFRQSQSNTPPRGIQPSFGDILEAVSGPGPTSATDPKPGLSLVDYRAHPVRSKFTGNGLIGCTQPVTKPSFTPNEPAAAPSLESSSGLPAASAPNTTSLRQNVGIGADTGPENAPLPNERQLIDNSIQGAANKYNLPASLIRGVIQAESDFQVRAVSPAGAMGLMQLMPGTADDMGVEDAFDIRQNIDGGARYLRKMLDMFGNDIQQALAAYNAGPGTVQRHRGIPPYPETQSYIARVLKYSHPVA